jgi:pyruvate dehydrogenase E2 component (dihydrolipoamide acetyltransferase)
MAEFVMPTLGSDMESGTLIAWKKKVGDHVMKGDIIAEVDTAKAALDIEVFTSGTIEQFFVQPGQEVPVGTVMAIIREDGESPGVGSPTKRAEAVQSAPPTLTAPPPASVAPLPVSSPKTPSKPQSAGEVSRLRISPSARQLAVERGVDPATVQGTGPDGVITREDIQRAATSKPAVPQPSDTAADRQARMRQAIAAAMARSKREIPHYYLSTTIDMGVATAWLKEENQKRGVPDRLLYGVLLIKAVALALREVPELNAIWKDGQAEQRDGVHVGVAISLRQSGLVAPALHDTDKQSLSDLMHNFQDLVKRARAGSLRSSELSEPTITVTSLGEQGVETVFGVIYPPQVALVGFGKLVERPWIVSGQVVARPVITASLSADHRVTDGHRGGLFLAAIDRVLQEPSCL